MKRAGLLLMMGVVAVLAALAVGAVAPVSAPKSSEIEQLQKEVATLRQRVASLEERLKDGSVVVIPKEGRSRPDIIDPYPGSRRVPPHWRQFEFNGMTYYIVPCDSASKSAGEPPKQVTPADSSTAPKTADNQ